jgi:hypothetical protein
MHAIRRLFPSARAVRGALALLVFGATLATGCLDRPVSPSEPNTTNIVVEKVLQERVDKIDLLFMIDNSASMADKQEILAAAVPQLVRRLVQPICLDDAGNPTGENHPCTTGTPEFEPVIDIHVGIVTSSLGAHGGNVCTDDAEQNDRAHLLPDVRPGLPEAAPGAGFLWWNPGSETFTDAQVDAFASDFSAHVKAAGEAGCGFEASLESWYRFLIDPEPPSAVKREGGATVTTRGPCADASNNPSPDADSVICRQRKDFLRPDSLVAIIMMSDENDCSIRDSDVGWYVSTTSNGSVQVPLAKPTAACAADPNSPCCRSCADTSPVPAGCDTSGCPGDLDPSSTDKTNHRCWDQKRRFGIDFLYPVQRYANALKQTFLCTKRLDLAMGDANDNGGIDFDECADDAAGTLNPLYSGVGGKTRDPALVFLAGIVGVPWQDIATDETLNDPANLEYRTAAELDDRWDWVTGDSVTPPQDPLMAESVAPRPGTHPLGPQFDPKDPSSPAGANPINGHEWLPESVQIGDLQYACVFPLTNQDDCDAAAPGEPCDCKGVTAAVGSGSYDKANPLCQSGSGYSSTQVQAKAYPGLRELGVLRAYGENSIVASICPKITGGDPQAPGYGYNPAVSAIIERLKSALGGRCLPRTIAVNPDGTVPCKVLEANLQGGACDCSQPGRVALGDPSVEGGAKLDAAVKSQLQKDKYCGGPDQPACSDYCVCMVQAYTGSDKQNCETQVDFTPDAGWCYVDPLDPPIGQKLGNPEIVERCEASDKRILRVEPTPGSIAYITCLGAPFSGSTAAAGDGG